jgi:hypothetical protein
MVTLAISIFPASRYWRVEFIGDRVVNHLISLCLFARNGSLEWDSDGRPLYLDSPELIPIQDEAL